MGQRVDLGYRESALGVVESSEEDEGSLQPPLEATEELPTFLEELLEIADNVGRQGKLVWRQRVLHALGLLRLSE